ncbi:MAG: class I SAM-dependent methyltransferase [Gammaproteobacteria bacterium]|nr:class I SAM-dependent methyltransferase [Gammaproteobacteria bacterium]
MFREVTAFWNKQYVDKPDGHFLRGLQTRFYELLCQPQGGKALPQHVYFADDCFVVYRNIGFLQDPDFQNALAKASVDPIILGRVWRVWVLAWAIQQRWKTEGVILDCGTYNGCALEVAIAYSTSRLGPRIGPVIACDLFDSPPIEARKSDHGPTLHVDVKRRLQKYGSNFEVIKGALPDSLASHGDLRITFCQIDLNSASADLATFESIYPRLIDGALVIFDDYGFNRYHETQSAIDAFLSPVHDRVLELPTGQGLYVHKSKL